MKLVKILILILFLLGSCRLAQINYSESFQNLIEDELKIKDFFENNSYQTFKFEMTDKQIVDAKDGSNTVILTSRDTTSFTVKIEEGVIQSISKSYVNDQNYTINKKYNIENNEIEITTTNSAGEIIGIYVESYFSGHYSDITIDSLGQSFEEWGKTNRKYP